MARVAVIAELYAEVRQRFTAFNDLAHGWEHVQRVYNLALRIAAEEKADTLITGAAALLHDIGRLVQHEGVHHADLSVEESRRILVQYALESEQVEAIVHAILAHSFTQGIEPRTLEARIVRDADRLDGLGAIGVMRWAITGAVKRQAHTLCYHPDDPFGERHTLDDRLYMLDHFYAKLLTLEEGMYTTTGRRLAAQRTAYMRGYLQQFKAELESEML